MQFGTGQMHAKAATTALALVRQLLLFQLQAAGTRLGKAAATHSHHLSSRDESTCTEFNVSADRTGLLHT